MKYKRIVASTKPVTTIRVAGKAHHFFHSEALGKCRAIIISPDENLPAAPTNAKHLSKGDKLDNLMNCSKRLGDRIRCYLDNYLKASDYESKRYWWEKLRAAEKGDSRVIRKMRELLES